jgi:hypothetical protein
MNNSWSPREKSSGNLWIMWQPRERVNLMRQAQSQEDMKGYLRRGSIFEGMWFFTNFLQGHLGKVAATLRSVSTFSMSGHTHFWERTWVGLAVEKKQFVEWEITTITIGKNCGKIVVMGKSKACSQQAARKLSVAHRNRLCATAARRRMTFGSS